MTRKYFMINLHERMLPTPWGQTCNLLITCRTRIRLSHWGQPFNDLLGRKGLTNVYHVHKWLLFNTIKTSFKFHSAKSVKHINISCKVTFGFKYISPWKRMLRVFIRSASETYLWQQSMNVLILQKVSKLHLSEERQQTHLCSCKSLEGLPLTGWQLHHPPVRPNQRSR